MENICNFCLKSFKTVYVLKKHQSTAKYCLKMQGKIKEKGKEFKCDACLKIMTTKNSYSEHLKICKEIKNKEIRDKEEEIRKLKNKNIELKNAFETKNKEKDKEINDLKLENLSLKSKLELYKSDHELVHELAKQPKNTNNISNNNKYMYLTPFSLTKSEIEEQVNNNFLKENFLKGQEGVADFAYNTFLIDENGNSKYVCNDPNRCTFTYKTKNGKISKDYKASNLTNLICEDVINKSSIISKQGIEEAEDKMIYVKNMEEIKNLKDNNIKFAKKLSMIINTKVDEILQEEDKPHEFPIEDEIEYVLESCSEDENTKEELLPLFDKYMEQKSNMLTLEHIKQGVSGYIDFALNITFKNRLRFVDDCFEYIDRYNRKITDKTGESICERFFKSLYKKSIIECQTYEDNLKTQLKEYKAKLSPEEISNNEHVISLLNSQENISKIRKEITKIKNGNESEFLLDFIDLLRERLM